MPCATLLLTVYSLFGTRKGATGERVEVRRNPGQPPQDAGAIKRHKLRLLLARRPHIDYNVVLMFSPLQPCQAPAEDFHFVGHAGPARR